LSLVRNPIQDILQLISTTLINTNLLLFMLQHIIIIAVCNC